MSRIQIPLDVLTSRLNLSDRFAGVRSQSLAARFANLKPISEFLDLRRLSKPANFSEVQSRVNYNLGHFSSNYAVVFAMLSIYSLLTNWLLLFVILLVVGGMWAIGKLDGNDFNMFGLQATSSQLYTALLVISVPLGIIASPISTILWLIGASFFRGGGLGGRPRSPKFVPSWGRPAGASGSRRRRQLEREQEFWQQEQSRVEELDSDDTDTQGVGLNFGKKRFASDPLQFTGIDLSSTASRSRQSYTYDESGSSSESDSELSEEFDGTNALQIALRDKEEALVQSALARIRRAQAKGKREVKLNQDELDALEKRRKRMQAAATLKEKKGSGSGSDKDKRRSQRQLVPIPSLEPKSRKRGQSRSGTPPPPGMMIAAADGSASYAPLGYYPQQAKAGRNSPARHSPARQRSSTTSQPLRGTPPPQFVSYQQSSSRHFSDGARPQSSSSNGSRRPLPDEEGWIPTNSRRSSIASQPMDPFEYQTSSNPSQQYIQGRRAAASGPEIAFSSLRRSPPNVIGGYTASSRGASDPTLRKRASRREDADELGLTSDDEDESDDLGNGVQVFVEREVPKEKSVPRKPIGGKKKGKGR